MLVSYYCIKSFCHIKDNIYFVLMHNNIVNGYQLLCHTHTVPEQHRKTADIFLYYFVLFCFFFCVFVTLRFIFLGTSIVCFNNLKTAADLDLWFLDRTSVCSHPWHLNDLNVFMVPLNLTEQVKNDIFQITSMPVGILVLIKKIFKRSLLSYLSWKSTKVSVRNFWIRHF